MAQPRISSEDSARARAVAHPPGTPAGGRRRSRATAVVVAAAGLGLTGAMAPTALAADVQPTDCNFKDKIFSVCSIVTNRLQVFGTRGGELLRTPMTKTGVRDIKGYIAGGSPKNTNIAWNNGSWDSYYLGGSTRGASGVATFRATTGALQAHSMQVETDYTRWWKGDDRIFSPSCPGGTYYACLLPKTYAYGDTNRGPAYVTGYASVETRPLIVKVLNMTDQPLVRSTEARETGALRDTQVADPATIVAAGPRGPGAGYYHYFRDASVANAVTASYTFANGEGSTSLTGSVIDLNVQVDADGTTERSSCAVPEGGQVTIECSVTMLGISGGILTALVSVGV